MSTCEKHNRYGCTECSTEAVSTLPEKKTQKVLRIVLEGAFVWYDVVVPDTFSLADIVVKLHADEFLFFINDKISLYAPEREIKTMSVWEVEVKDAPKTDIPNVIQFPPGGKS